MATQIFEHAGEAVSAHVFYGGEQRGRCLQINGENDAKQPQFLSMRFDVAVDMALRILEYNSLTKRGGSRT